MIHYTRENLQGALRAKPGGLTGGGVTLGEAQEGSPQGSQFYTDNNLQVEGSLPLARAGAGTGSPPPKGRRGPGPRSAGRGRKAGVL